MNDLVVGAT
jgi:hypothetical protein